MSEGPSGVPDASPRELDPDWLAARASAASSFTSDEARMTLVVDLARHNVIRGSGGPFGAAIFDLDSGELIAAAVNRVVPLENPLMHAEIIALMHAHERLGTRTLRQDSRVFGLFASCDPCAMCLGAVLWSGARRLVCGATRDDARRVGFDEGPVFDESYEYLRGRGVEIRRGLLREAARGVLELYAEGGGPVYNP